ncbi:MAG: polymer-forming cytoskeletal protein [Ignavibacteriales bacterium]|nr:polymer-forming cytoskeletal protein [Ignavibacteriales bacterium]
MANKVDPAKEINILGAGTVVEGKIRGQGSFRIDGKLIGDISASEDLAVGVTGEIEGNVTAKNVTVGGKIRGSITAQEKVVFESKSVVRGDIRASKFIIDEGSIFDGRVSMAEKSPLYEVRH